MTQNYPKQIAGSMTLPPSFAGIHSISQLS